MAEGTDGAAQAAGVPKAGYVFTVLTGQGAAATGGARSYVTPAVAAATAAMTLGYGMSAIASAYDGTGRDAFIINNNGTIFQKDRTSTVTGHETLFNPDTTRQHGRMDAGGLKPEPQGGSPGRPLCALGWIAGPRRKAAQAAFLFGDLQIPGVPSVLPAVIYANYYYSAS